MLQAQNYPDIKRTYHWYFGDAAGIDFSSGVAVADTTGQMHVYSGCSVISDTAGKLLFYTDGETVWNRNHQVMLNGTGLFGGTHPQQGSVIVPQPGNDSIYFIFHQKGVATGDDPWINGLHYSIVNMKSDSGLGEVKQKNIELFRPNDEQLVAVHHANKCDVWVMGHEYRTNIWHAFLVTANGVNTTPVTTMIGAFPDTTINPWLPNGLKAQFSPDGKKLASDVFWDTYNFPGLSDTLNLYDFDNSNGTLSNMISIPHSEIGTFSFSNDNTKLYIYEWHAVLADTIPWGAALFFQYDITSNTQSGIIATKTRIMKKICPTCEYDFCDFQNTPDNRIFIAKTETDTVLIIHSPNNMGTACNLDTIGMSLNGRIAGTSLPNFIQSYFGKDTTGCYTTAINEISKLPDEIKIYPNPFTTTTTIILPDETKNAILILYDLMGNIIWEMKSKTNTITIPRDNLQEGIYILQINVNSNFYNYKLIITN